MTGLDQASSQPNGKLLQQLLVGHTYHQRDSMYTGNDPDIPFYSI